MHFGLNNVGATYQWCMQACLKDQIGRNIEVYVDDIVVKTNKVDSSLDDLRETFKTLTTIASSSTRRSALSEYPPDSSWDISSLSEGLKVIQRRLTQS
jgi:hypothetical protein